MAEVPEDRKYTNEHEWVQQTESGSVRVGITDYAQQALGDVVFVQLPDVGTHVSGGDAIGEVESTKSVSDVYAPLAGTVTARNDLLESSPEMVNNSPYEAGWLFEIELNEGSGLDDLLDPQAYVDLTS